MAMDLGTLNTARKRVRLHPTCGVHCITKKRESGRSKCTSNYTAEHGDFQLERKTESCITCGCACPEWLLLLDRLQYRCESEHCHAMDPLRPREQMQQPVKHTPGDDITVNTKAVTKSFYSASKIEMYDFVN